MIAGVLALVLVATTGTVTLVHTADRAVKPRGGYGKPAVVKTSPARLHRSRR